MAPPGTEAVADPTVYDARLARARKAYAATADKYNALPIPTLEALLAELREDNWLTTVVHYAAQNCMFASGMPHDIRPKNFDQPADEHLHSFNYTELVSIVPYVRRLGYCVTLYSHKDVDWPFAISHVGHGQRPLRAKEARLAEYAHYRSRYPIWLHGTSPAQIRRRGLLKCVPRLLGWLRAARIKLGP